MRLAGASRAPSAPSSPQRDRAVGAVRPTAVLAPADQKQQQTGAKPGAQRGLTGAILTALRSWETRQTSVEASRAAAELTEATAQWAQQVGILASGLPGDVHWHGPAPVTTGLVGIATRAAQGGRWLAGVGAARGTRGHKCRRRFRPRAARPLPASPGAAAAAAAPSRAAVLLACPATFSHRCSPRVDPFSNLPPPPPPGAVFVPAPQADALEEAGKAAKDQAPLPDIMAYLRPAGIMETRYMRVLSSLSALTYNLEHLTVSRHMGAGCGNVAPGRRRGRAQ